MNSESKITKIIFRQGQVTVHRVFKVKDNSTLVLFEDGLSEESVLSINDSAQSAYPMIKQLNNISFPSGSHLLDRVSVTLSDGSKFDGQLLDQRKNKYFYKNAVEESNNVYVGVSDDNRVVKMLDLKSTKHQTEEKTDVSIKDIQSKSDLYNSMIRGSLFIELFGTGEREVEVVYKYSDSESEFKFIKKLQFVDSSSPSTNNNNNNNASKFKENNVIKVTQSVTISPRFDFVNVPVDFELSGSVFSIPSLSCSKYCATNVVLSSATFQSRVGFYSLADFSAPTLEECILFENSSPHNIVGGSFANYPNIYNVTHKSGELVVLHFKASAQPSTDSGSQINSGARYSKAAYFSSSASNMNTQQQQQHPVQRKNKISGLKSLLSKGKRPKTVTPFEVIKVTHEEYLKEMKASACYTCLYTYNVATGNYRYLNVSSEDMEIIFQMPTNVKPVSNNLARLEGSIVGTTSPAKPTTRQRSRSIDEEDAEELVEELLEQESSLYTAVIPSDSVFDFTLTNTVLYMNKYAYGPSDLLQSAIKPSKISSTSSQLETFDLASKNILAKEYLESMAYAPKNRHTVQPTTNSNSISNSSSSSFTETDTRSVSKTGGWFSSKK